jgi:hypothetical protein
MLTQNEERLQQETRVLALLNVRMCLQQLNRSLQEAVGALEKAQGDVTRELERTDDVMVSPVCWDSTTYSTDHGINTACARCGNKDGAIYGPNPWALELYGDRHPCWMCAVCREKLQKNAKERMMTDES